MAAITASLIAGTALTAPIIAAGVTGAVAAGGSALNIIQGSNAKGEAEDAASKAAQSLAQMQEADKFKSLQVPTLGLEMAQQNVQARQAQQLQGLRDIGAAGVLGGLTALNQQGQAEDLQLAAQAQQAQYARDLAQAQNAQGVEQRNLARKSGLEQQRLEGAQAAAAYGQSQINMGIQGIAQTAGNLAGQYMKDQPLWGQDTTGVNLKPYQSQLTNQQTQQIGTNAQQALAPQLNKMMPQGIMTPAQSAMKSNFNYNQNLQGLRAAQGQYDAFKLSGLRAPQSAFDQQYAWNPINNEWYANSTF
jgi:hypothetical protein